MLATRKLTTDQKGAIAEAKIAASAIELGVGVSKPLAPLRYDLIFDVGKQLIRVQCKWASLERDTLTIRCRRCRRGPSGFVHRGYEDDEVDAFAAYCLDVDRCYFITVDRVARRTNVLLRLAPTRNNQQALVNWAKDYEFDATLSQLLGP